MSENLKPTVILMGAAGAIGSALIDDLRHDHHIFAIDGFHRVDGSPAERELRENSESVKWHYQNLNDNNAMEAVLKSALDSLESPEELIGIIDLAGMHLEKVIARTKDEDVDRLMQTFMLRPWRLLRALDNTKVRDLSVIWTTDTQSLMGTHKRAAMSMCHSALVGLIRSAAIDLRKTNIRLNAISATCRSRINADNPLISRANADSYQAKALVPLYRHLLSTTSRRVSGQVFSAVDGIVQALQLSQSRGNREPIKETKDVAAVWDEIIRGRS